MANFALIESYLNYFKDEQQNIKPMKSIYTTKFILAEIKDIDAKQGVVAGYFANFNTLDSDGDIIRKGAFNQSIQEWFPKGRVKHLLNHDVSKPLGKIIDLFEDDYGLFYKSEIGKHQLGQDFIKMAESGLVTEHSIGFRTLNEKSTELGNEITHVQLYEGSSLTGWGSNPNTPLVSIKSLSNETIAERLKSFEQFVRKTTVSDETIELCLIHIKQLYAQLNNSGKLAEAVNLPDVKAEIDNSNLILEINKTFKQWQTKF
jgi:HK97 family phage prohead protease